MKNNFTCFIVTVVTLMFSPLINFGQMPDLGTAANFVLFTTTGAVASTGISQITGNVGTGTGSITGFGTLNGLIYNSDAVTTQATADLTVAYNDLSSRVPTFFPGPVLGDGQSLTAGVYSLPAAASLNTGLFLDAGGDSNAIFVLQIGGAFSTNVSSEVFLINGALAANVFWVVNGAVPMAAGTIMCGTIIANNAAISLGVTGKFFLSFTGDRSQVISTEIYNALGERILESTGFLSTLDLSGKAAGAYFVQVNLFSKTIHLTAVVRK